MSVKEIVQKIYADQQEHEGFFQNHSEAELAVLLAPFLRQRAIEHLRTSPAMIASAWRMQHDELYLQGLEELNRVEWLEEQGQDRVWGTVHEAMALGELFDIGILITPVKNGVAQDCMQVFAPAKPGRPVIHLYNEDDTHWYFYGNHSGLTKGGGNCLYHSFVQALSHLAIHAEADQRIEQNSNLLRPEYQAFAAQLALIEAKAAKFAEAARTNPRYTRAAEKSAQLVRELKQHRDDYYGLKIGIALRVDDPAEGLIVRSNKSANTFVTHCLASINKVRAEMEKHRGWKQILGNIALALVGLLVGYAVAVAINHLTTGRYLFFNTDTAQKLDDMENFLKPAQLRV